MFAPAVIIFTMVVIMLTLWVIMLTLWVIMQSPLIMGPSVTEGHRCGVTESDERSHDQRGLHDHHKRDGSGEMREDGRP
jgi:hypothetical protein